MYENSLQPVMDRSRQQTTYVAYSTMDDVFPRKTSIVQPMPLHPVTNTPEKENQPLKPLSISPVLPGTGSITHNVTRMLNETEGAGKGQLPSTATRASRFTPYSTSHFMSYRQKILQDASNRTADDLLADVADESQEHLRTSDAPNITDSSISTQGSSSPQSTASSSSTSSPTGSARSSPGSGGEQGASPENGDGQTTKKKPRTNYTNEQVQTLLKIFHENPYPDSEMMENIGKDMGVPENKIKIWFQNKRARWRRRVNDNMNAAGYAQQFVPMSPMLSPVPQYGFMPGMHMMSSSPQHVGGYFNYPWMQPGSISPNNNTQVPLAANPAHVQSRLQANQSTTMNVHGQQFPPITMTTPSVSTLSSATPYSMTSQPQMMTSQTGRHYSQFLYQSNYGGTSGYSNGQ